MGEKRDISYKEFQINCVATPPYWRDDLNLHSLLYTAHHDFLQSQMEGGYTLTLCGKKKNRLTIFQTGDQVNKKPVKSMLVICTLDM